MDVFGADSDGSDVSSDESGFYVRRALSDRRGGRLSKAQAAQALLAKAARRTAEERASGRFVPPAERLAHHPSFRAGGRSIMAARVIGRLAAGARARGAAAGDAATEDRTHALLMMNRGSLLPQALASELNDSGVVLGDPAGGGGGGGGPAASGDASVPARSPSASGGAAAALGLTGADGLSVADDASDATEGRDDGAVELDGLPTARPGAAAAPPPPPPQAAAARDAGDIPDRGVLTLTLSELLSADSRDASGAPAAARPSSQRFCFARHSRFTAALRDACLRCAAAPAVALVQEHADAEHTRAAYATAEEQVGRAVQACRAQRRSRGACLRVRSPTRRTRRKRAGGRRASLPRPAAACLAPLTT